MSNFKKAIEQRKQEAAAQPPVEHDENAPAVRSSTHVIHTTRSSGPDRGVVEQMLAYLASLAPDEEEDTNAA